MNILKYNYNYKVVDKKQNKMNQYYKKQQNYNVK